MTSIQNSFKIGSYHPIYLWGGPGTIRMNQLKFMQVPVDEIIHNQAHTEVGADIVVGTMKQNWIHLTYSWGFPPEVEIEDWNSFEQATQIYHQKGQQVFAYIQSSNCVYDGSFTQKNWYTIDPSGKKHYYYSGRYMTCFQNQAWINYLKERISDAISRGADGIFFDNLWYGAQPTALLGTWLGSAGCYCDLCKNIYQQDTGKSIPELINLQNPDSLTYIHWRASKMTEVFALLSAFARKIKPDVIISANDYDLIMRPSYLVYGIDFPKLAEIQDLTMIENFALPLWSPGKLIRFANNALTIRNALAMLPKNKHLSVLSYDVGIGFDGVYPVRRYLQGMAEAAALGSSMTTKGTEYFDGKKMTLLTSPEYSEIHKNIGQFSQWLKENQSIYADRKNINPIALCHPGDALWQNWFELAPVYFGVAQTLLKAGIPWRIIKTGDDLKHVSVLLTFTDAVNHGLQIPPEIIHIFIPNIEGWSLPKRSIVSKSDFLKKLAAWFSENLIRSYHQSKMSRKIMDSIGMAKMITQTSLFFLPPTQKQTTLLNAIPFKKFPHIESEHPVLIDVWETQKGIQQIHLVNYANNPQMITLVYPENGQGTSVDYPGNIHHPFNGNRIDINLDLYTMCFINTHRGET